MSERIRQINVEQREWQQRKSEAILTVLEANDHLLRLQSEKNALGAVATRHLHVVPDLPYEYPEDRPDGAA